MLLFTISRASIFILSSFRIILTQLRLIALIRPPTAPRPRAFDLTPSPILIT